MPSQNINSLVRKLHGLLDIEENRCKALRKRLHELVPDRMAVNHQSPECQDEYDFAVAASETRQDYDAALATAQANQQTASDLETAAWSEYFDCESP